MKRLVIYFHYDPAGCIDTACRIAVQAVQKYGRVVFVTNGTLAPADRVWVRQSGAGRIERENVGFDVGAYREALLTLGREKLAEYEEIVLIDEVGNPYAQGKISNANQREQLDYRKIAEGLCVAVCGNDLTGISSLLENLGNKWVESGYDLEQIRIRYVSTYVSVMYLLKIQSEEIFKQEGMVDVVILQISRLSHLQSINSFFLDKLSQIAQKLNSNQQGNVIRKMKEYIEANYNSDLTLKNLSKIFHYNVAYFGKLFKSNTGMSYNDYVTSVRMEKAKELLCSTNMKVAQISERVGFANVSYFCRSFREYYGSSPESYRKGTGEDEQTS